MYTPLTDNNRSQTQDEVTTSSLSPPSNGIQLEHSWVFYFDRRMPRGQDIQEYESSVCVLGEFSTVQVRFVITVAAQRLHGPLLLFKQINER
jgi:hypothetical protein